MNGISPKLSAAILVVVLIMASCSTLEEKSPPMSITPLPTASPTAVITPTITPLPPTPTLVPESNFIQGVSLNNIGLRLDSRYARQIITEHILPAGMNYVALTPTCMGRDANDIEIACEYKRVAGKSGPPVMDGELINTIQYLHSVGLRVVLKPHFLLISELENDFSGPPTWISME